MFVQFDACSCILSVWSRLRLWASVRNERSAVYCLPVWQYVAMYDVCWKSVYLVTAPSTLLAVSCPPLINTVMAFTAFLTFKIFLTFRGVVVLYVYEVLRTLRVFSLYQFNVFPGSWKRVRWIVMKYWNRVKEKAQEDYIIWWSTGIIYIRCAMDIWQEFIHT